MAEKSGKSVIRVIISDFGKTIYDYDMDGFYNWLAVKFGIPRYLFCDIFSVEPGGLVDRYERGLIGKKAFFAESLREAGKLVEDFRKETGRAVDFPEISEEEFFKARNAVMDTGLISIDILNLFRRLKEKDYRLYVLSNIDRDILEYLKAGGGKNGCGYSFRELLSFLDRFFASCDEDIRSVKRRPGEFALRECEEIFRKVLVISGSQPEETVFIDDIKEFVEVFQGMGGYGIHCAGSWAKIESRLYKLGVRWE